MKISTLITRIVDLFYIEPIHRVIPLQMFRYAFCGAANMALGIVIYWFIFHFIIPYDNYLDLGIVYMSPKIQALFLQFPVTLLIGFWLNKYVAFKASPLRNKTQLFRYILSVSGALLLNYGLMKLFGEELNIYPTHARVPTEIIVAVYSFLMSKFFTFKGSLSS